MISTRRRRHFSSISSVGLVCAVALGLLFGLACSTGGQYAAAQSRVSEESASAQPVRLSFLGDAGRWNAQTKELKESMERMSVRRLVMPGDNLYKGTYDAAWGPWQKSGFEFPIVAIGNHHAGYANEIQYFDMPGEVYSKTLDGFLKFIVLNSDNKTTVDTQMDFLTSELRSATEPFVFVVYHHPTFTLTKDHVWTERKKFQEAIRPILVAYRKKITAVVLGHDHIASMGHFGDLPYILSGSGQNLRRGQDVDNVQEGTRVISGWLRGGDAIWIQMEAVAQKPTIEFKAIRAKDDQSLCTVQIATGQLAKFGADCLAR